MIGRIGTIVKWLIVLIWFTQTLIIVRIISSTPFKQTINVGQEQKYSFVYFVASTAVFLLILFFHEAKNGVRITALGWAWKFVKYILQLFEIVIGVFIAGVIFSVDSGNTWLRLFLLLLGFSCFLIVEKAKELVEKRKGEFI